MEGGPWRLSRKLDSENNNGNSLGEGHIETHLCVEMDSGLSSELSDWELGPCEGIHTRGSNKNLGEE